MPPRLPSLVLRATTSGACRIMGECIAVVSGTARNPRLYNRCRWRSILLASSTRELRLTVPKWHLRRIKRYVWMTVNPVISYFSVDASREISRGIKSMQYSFPSQLSWLVDIVHRLTICNDPFVTTLMYLDSIKYGARGALYVQIRGMLIREYTSV